MLLEIINLMIELQNDTYKEAITELRANKNLDAEFVEHLIHFTSEQRNKKIRQSLIAQQAQKLS